MDWMSIFYFQFIYLHKFQFINECTFQKTIFYNKAKHVFQFFYEDEAQVKISISNPFDTSEM